MYHHLSMSLPISPHPTPASCQPTCDYPTCFCPVIVLDCWRSLIISKLPLDWFRQASHECKKKDEEKEHMILCLHCSHLCYSTFCIQAVYLFQSLAKDFKERSILPTWFANCLEKTNTPCLFNIVFMECYLPTRHEKLHVPVSTH